VVLQYEKVGRPYHIAVVGNANHLQFVVQEKRAGTSLG
jgi:hypothetical protein